MGVLSFLFHLSLGLHFIFSFHDEEKVRQIFAENPNLASIQEEILSFAEDIQHQNYHFSSQFLLKKQKTNEFEQIFFYQRDFSNLEWHLESPSQNGGACGLRTDLHIVKRSTKQHIATLFFTKDCNLQGISHYVNGIIYHHDLDGSSLELQEVNPPLKVDIEPIDLPGEDFSMDHFAKKSEVRICVIDNGFKLDHPGLVERLVPNLAFDLSDGDSNPFSYSPHGTHVAGIAARGSHKIKIIPVKVSTKDNQSLGQIWRSDEEIRKNVLYEINEALNFCDRAGASIINMSLVYGEGSTEMLDHKNLAQQLQWRADFLSKLKAFPHFLYVVAAGNLAISLDSSSLFPAGAALPNLITVGAYDTFTQNIWRDDPWNGSNYSSKLVDILAPGTLIESFSLQAEIEAFSGTSMASPFVANLAAKVLLLHPDFTAKQIKTFLLNHAEKRDSLRPYARDGKVIVSEKNIWPSI